MHADVMRAINVQINSEFTAWYQYLAMAAFCEREKFTGASQWLKRQSLEEYQHGMKLFDFVLARNGVVELTKIEQPTREFESFAEVFESALKQEEGVTAEINSLYELCFQEQGVRRDDRASVVSHRAGRGGEDLAGDCCEVPPRRRRPGLAARSRPRARRARGACPEALTWAARFQSGPAINHHDDTKVTKSLRLLRAVRALRAFVENRVSAGRRHYRDRARDPRSQSGDTSRTPASSVREGRRNCG